MFIWDTKSKNVQIQTHLAKKQMTKSFTLKKISLQIIWKEAVFFKVVTYFQNTINITKVKVFSQWFLIMFSYSVIINQAPYFSSLQHVLTNLSIFLYSAPQA